MTSLTSRFGFVGWLALCFGVAWIGSLAMPSDGAWYAGLAKPAWTPPGWLFAPVWTVLYAMMAVAAWLVWRDRGFRHAPLALTLFLLQLALNGLWTWLFFGLQRPGLACAEIALLWTTIGLTLLGFWTVRPLAGALLAPYLAWVSFAGVLNAVIWRLNR